MNASTILCLFIAQAIRMHLIEFSIQLYFDQWNMSEK